MQWSECMYWVPNTMDDVYKNIDEYKQNINWKNLNAFDDMIADIMTNKKFQALIKEVFISWRKLNISLVFIKQCYFSVSKDIRLNSTHLIMKINNKRELFDYKEFKLVDKTDKELKLEGETKNIIKEIKEGEKSVDKKGYSWYFNDESSVLVSKLLSQNTQDLKKMFGRN